MDFWFWTQITGAVVFGNALFSCLAFFLYRVSQQERAGRKAEDLPVWVFILGLVPIFALIAVVLSLT